MKQDKKRDLWLQSAGKLPEKLAADNLNNSDLISEQESDYSESDEDSVDSELGFDSTIAMER